MLNVYAYQNDPPSSKLANTLINKTRASTCCTTHAPSGEHSHTPTQETPTNSIDKHRYAHKLMRLRAHTQKHTSTHINKHSNTDINLVRIFNIGNQSTQQ